MAALSKQQSDLIRRQLVAQIDATFPEDKKESAKKQILNMNDEQLIEFLKQNKLIQSPVKEPISESAGTQECIFCAIIKGNIPHYKIDENKDSIAILEINPISKGHTIIIPKKHTESQAKLPQGTFSLAKKISKKLQTRLKPKDIKMFFVNIMGHEVINILPVYKDEKISSPRKSAKKEELEKIQRKLEKKTAIKTAKSQKTKKKKAEKKEKLWLPKRIP